jgi:DNA polymerase
MKTIIAGSRTLTQQDTAAGVACCPWPITEVVSGAARGPDTHGEEYARHFGLTCTAFPADWDGPLKLSAGLARNEDMGRYADALVAIWDGKSAGTRHMIEFMKSLGKPVHVHSVVDARAPARQLVYDATLPAGRTFWGEPSNGNTYPVALSDLLAGTVIENVGTYRSTVRPSMDFETYSEAGYVIIDGKVKGAGGGSTNGLGLVGTGVYAEHPTTEVLCLFYDLKEGKGRRGWWPGMPQPVDLLTHIANGGDIEAFNSTFEFFIWNFVCTRKYGWPELKIEQTYCVMSMSRRWGLPGSLSNASKALGTKGKDKEGGQLIGKLCRPNTVTKTRLAVRRTMATDWPLFQGLFSYCDQDVEAEDEVAAMIPDLTPYERGVWLADQRINARGVLVDTVALEASLKLLQDTTAHYTKELQQITNGAINTASEVAKMLAWLAGRGVRMMDMTSDSVDEALAMLKADPLSNPPQDCIRVLEIRQALSSANVKKLAKLRHQLNSDGRLRNQYMYCGAERTGRWSSAAADDNASNSQLQNITAKGPKSRECEACGRIFGAHLTDCPQCGSFMCHDRDEWTVEAVEYAVRDIIAYGFEGVLHLWGSPIDVLCGCLRGLFVAKEAYDFVCCDFSAVEAVALACLARCQWRIDVFKTHGKIYEMSASKITGVSFEEMMQYKKDTGVHHPSRKKIGKVAELASGYGGWVGAWCAFGADAFMDEAEIKKNVLAWRAESPEIVEFWGGQFRQTGPRLSDGHPEYFGLEGAAVQAVLYPGKQFWANDISFGVHEAVLYCRLPSGRLLAYHDPKLTEVAGKWGKPASYSLTFMGFNSNPKNGARGWGRMETYGGRLCENVTQAVCADIQAEAIVRAEAASYPVVMHTHDELCAEVPEGFGSVDELCAIMGQSPDWASWWPLKAAGWRHKRYQKD